MIQYYKMVNIVIMMYQLNHLYVENLNVLINKIQIKHIHHVNY
jgi:hypothetical protein